MQRIKVAPNVGGFGARLKALLDGEVQSLATEGQEVGWVEGTIYRD